MNENNFDFGGWAYAGFWRRLIAFIIDGILILILLSIMWGTATDGAFELAYWEDYQHHRISINYPWWAELLEFVIPTAYIVGFWLWKSATPGKMVVGARIVDHRTGAEPSGGQFIGRYFAYIVSSVLFGLGFLWAAFDKRKQGWHDKLAGTVVVCSKPRSPSEDFES